MKLRQVAGLILFLGIAVSARAQVISQVVTDSASSPQRVTINGFGFTSRTTVSLSGMPLSISSISSQQVVATLPAGIAAGDYLHCHLESDAGRRGASRTNGAAGGYGSRRPDGASGSRWPGRANWSHWAPRRAGADGSGGAEWCAWSIGTRWSHWASGCAGSGAGDLYLDC
jgi:hypothetical protein